MRIQTVIGVAAAAMLAAPGLSQTAPAAPPAANGTQPEKKICKRDKATGSIMARSVCRTKAEWDAITAQSKQNLENGRDLQNQHSTMQGQHGA